ncbi:MAG: polyisoprenoid-binding protein [Bacteroidetes bacterium]|nr:MAG: polyisoprenoid-binding protein [Bacteroidota bacterium]RLD75114.1 MAG: polyisoprenoid-binding protein [Bacteroidota bacterium]
MKRLNILFIVLILVISINAQNNWAFDVAHSSVNFTVSHMVISEVDGRFDKFEGSVSNLKDDFSDAKIEFTIDVASVNTGDEKRDTHLKNVDFFDAEKFPKMKFASKSMKKVSGNKYKLTGSFTMHGVTKDVTLDAKYGGTIKDPWGNTKAGFKITGVLNRTDWGLKYNSVMEAGGLMIGEEIEITCKIELIKK